MKGKYVFIGLLIALAIFGFSFVSEYICAHTCQYTESSDNYTAFTRIFCAFVAYVGKNIEGFSLVFTTAATVVMAWFTWLLYGISKLTESSARIIERAYVFARVARKEAFVITEIGNGITKIEVIFTNSGKTPAIIRKMRADYLISDKAPTELIAHKRAESEIAGGLSISNDAPYIERVNVKISKVEWGEMERLDKTLYILGKIEYDDVFNVRRETGFCWQYLSSKGSDGFIISPIPVLNYYT